jgi:thioredoxin 1
MNVLEVNSNDWEKEVLQSDTLVLVNFGHQRCGWCLRLEPIYNDVAKDYNNKVKFVKFDVLTNNENQRLATKYGVMSTPSLIFICEGRSVETVIGFQSKERLKQLIDDVIDKHQECLKQSTKLKTS